MSAKELNEIFAGLNKPGWIDYVVLVCSVITAFTIVFYIQDYIISKRKFRTENAIGIAKDYADKIIDLSRYILEVYRVYDVLRIADKLDTSNIHLFTNQEMIKIYNDEDMEKFENIYAHTLPVDLLLPLLCCRCYISGNLMIDAAYQKLSNAGNQDQETIKSILPILKQDFKCCIHTMLNSLEYICMMFMSNIVNDSVVYQSLHQTFLRSVKCLYYFIAKNNTSWSSKNYTNITSLYNRWNEKFIKTWEKENKMGERLPAKPVNT